MTFQFVIWAHFLNKQEAEKIASLGFDKVIAIGWDEETYDYLNSQLVTVYYWIRNLQKDLTDAKQLYKKNIVDGFVIDPEKPFYNKEAQHYYTEYLPNYYKGNIYDEVFGTATWVYQLPIFKKQGTILINKFYGIELTGPWIVKIFGRVYSNINEFYPMNYAFKPFLADKRVRWALEGWKAVYEEEYKGCVYVYPILQAFSQKELGDGNNDWKPSLEQLKKWVQWTYELEFDGVAFFCWDTFKKYPIREVNELLE